MLEEDNIDLANWRSESGLKSKIFYRKKFALAPVRCKDGTLVFLKYYYKKYVEWNTAFRAYSHDYLGHVDFVENVSSEDYVVRKLAEGL